MEFIDGFEFMGYVHLICSAYIPPDRDDHFDLFIENLEYVFKIYNGPILMMGDFNCRNYTWEKW